MNVGDYVKTKDGRIGKIIQEEYITPCNDKHRYLYLTDADNEMWYDEETIIKSSPNIIDLIEVGDYVNGYYVEDIRQRYDGEMITILEVATGSNYFQAPMYEEDIKSILTKEMFEQMEYKIQ